MEYSFRVRLITTLIVSLIFWGMYQPLILVWSGVLLILGWFLFYSKKSPFYESFSHSADQKFRRKSALSIARIYLSPYKSIWKNLKLSNKFCSLSLDSDGITIYGKEKKSPYRKFRILTSYVHNYPDLWDMFCTTFNHYKTYEDLIEDCRLFKLTIYEYAIQPERNTYEQNKTETVRTSPSNLLDINNCSEIEITELPGISIVMAKKIVKKRDEIGGFKTIDDFFIFIKLKPHMETQLREKICVKKMKGIIKQVKNNTERSVDL